MRTAAISAGIACLVAMSVSAPCQGIPEAELARPTAEQVAWHDMEIEMFLCLDPCTWQDKEYDDHSTPLEKINPEKLDTDQWADVAVSMGAKQIVFVAKHVGGFCWWQTETSDYGVRNTPWRGGKGDVVKDLAESCRKRNLKLGIYLSPADDVFGAGVGGRCKTEDKQKIYNDVYRKQLTELLSRYGEIAEVWFDGSNVIEVGDILDKFAPRAIVFQGPRANIRWVGNELGVAPYPGWNSVSVADSKSGGATALNGNPDGRAWMPLECDARIRNTWFWNTKNADTLKSVDELMEMYYASVGRGAVLLLNNTPDTSGLIPEADVKRSAEFGAEIRRRLGSPLSQTKGESDAVELDLGEAKWVDHAITMEDIAKGERVREYVIEGFGDGKWKALCSGTAIGHKRIDRFPAAQVSKIRIRFTKSAAKPIIRNFAVFDTWKEDPAIVKRLAKPTPQQADWHDCEIGMFIHFAPNTWTDNEGDDLSLPLEKMNPTALDTEQWVDAAEAMGAKYIVFVAKHVGGFCMWRTDTTDYGIMNTPWRGGKGDVLADLSESCRKRVMKLGVYLSPCDRKHGAGVGGRCNSEAAQKEYDKLYRQQLTEVLNRYGEMYEVWFDGSNIVDVGDILKKHAPKAMIFQGPHATIRWVGNEDGTAPYPAWNSLTTADLKSGVATGRHGNPDGEEWLPNECDARMRNTWFWNTTNAPTLKTVSHLMDMYYRSVGYGCVLLLNHTPDPTGAIPEADVKRGAEFAAEINRRFGKSIAETEGRGGLLEIAFPEPTEINHAITMERIEHGERVREYAIEGFVDGDWRLLCKGTAIGHKKIDRFRPVVTSKIRFRCINAATTPMIRRFAVFCVEEAGAQMEPPSHSPVGLWRFDKIEAGRFADDSGRQRHGTAKSVELADGRGGKAAKLSGREGFIDIGEVGFFRSDFTISAWVKPASAKGVRLVMSKETSCDASNQCRFYLADDNRLGFMLSDSWDVGIWPFESEAVAPVNEWSNIAVTRSGVCFILYLNGREVARRDSSAVIRHYKEVSAKIGGEYDTSGNFIQVFNGLIDDVTVFNRPLKPAEVTALSKGEMPSAGATGAAWKWSPETINKEWTTIDIDITPFCVDAAQYLVTFRKDAGQDDIEVKSLTLFFDNRETPEFVQKADKPNAYFVTIGGVNVPLKLRAVVRGKGGIQSSGSAIIEKHMP